MLMLCLPGMAAAWYTALQGATLDDDPDRNEGLKGDLTAYFIQVRGALAGHHLRASCRLCPLKPGVPPMRIAAQCPCR